MRNRTPDCNTPSAQLSPSEASGDADSWLWFITEKGHRVLPLPQRELLFSAFPIGNQRPIHFGTVP